MTDYLAMNMDLVAVEMGQRSGRRYATQTYWAMMLPGGENVYVLAVGGGHDIAIDLNGEGYLPRCETCEWTGTRTQSAMDASGELLAHVESRN